MTCAEQVESILVYVGSNPDDAIGENILKLPFIRAIKMCYPDARLTWIAGIGPCQYEGILASVVDGRIDEYITDFALNGSLSEFIFRWQPLGDRKFDVIFDAQQNPVRTLVLKRISHKLFISACWNFIFSDRKPLRGKPPASQVTERLLALTAAASGEIVKPSPIWPLDEKWHRAAARLLPDGPIYVGLAPGAGKQGTGKCWPFDRYLALAQEQHRKGRTPVFFIRPDESEWFDRIRRDASFALVPELDAAAADAQGPALAMALAHRLQAAVANCSGIGHILAAGGTPMVSLFGPTQPGKYAAYATSLIALKATDFGTTADIDNIPLAAVSDSVDEQIAAHAGSPTTVRARP